MSNKDVEEERRLYQCVRTYEKIVKQFDQVIEMMDARNKPPKRKRNFPAASAQAREQEENEVLVQTITRFLHELRNPEEPDCPVMATERD